jgi:uncharacterized protein YecT (DUF1311 family)
LRVLALVLTVLPAAVVAKEELVTIYGPVLAQCYAAAVGFEAKTACIGALALECMEKEDGGQTTVGMSMCNRAEAEFWDGLLNKEYQLTMAWAKANDIEETKFDSQFANLANALRDAQRAWITFRDAECGLAYAVWGSGSMCQIAGSSCFADMVAERTIELRDIREMFE